MKTSRTITCTIGLVATGLFVSGNSAAAFRGTQASAATTAPTTATRIDALVQRAIKDEHFSGTVLVRQGTTMLLRKGYGASGSHRGVVNTPSTRFAFPGMTALFTAVAIEQLSEHGKLAPRVTSSTQANRGSTGLAASIRLIQRVSGESYTTYLQRHMFEPLGMLHTQVRQHAGGIPEVYSTVDDLDRWNQAVLGCMLVSPQSLFASAAPGHQQLEAVSVQHGAAAGERLILGHYTAIVVLANQSRAVRHLLTAIQAVLPTR